MSVGVGASDFITIPQFAWTVYKLCRDSAGEYAALAEEVRSMHATLRRLDTWLPEIELSDATKADLAIVYAGCRKSLECLRDELVKYKSLGTRKKLLMHRIRMGMKNVGRLREHLHYHVSVLTLFTLTLSM